MKRVFLDANILVSAAWSETNGVLTIWVLPGLQLVTSLYALQEAERNIQLKNPGAAVRLAHLVRKLEICVANAELNDDYDLPDKDRPILQAAVAAKCHVLLTGDKAHFGHLFGQDVEGVRVLKVSMLTKELELPSGVLQLP